MNAYSKDGFLYLGAAELPNGAGRAEVHWHEQRAGTRRGLDGTPLWDAVKPQALKAVGARSGAFTVYFPQSGDPIVERAEGSGE